MSRSPEGPCRAHAGTGAPTPGASAGCFGGGLPYDRIGFGPRQLVVFQGLMLESKPMSGLTKRFILGSCVDFEGEHGAYVITRRPGVAAHRLVAAGRRFRRDLRAFVTDE